MSTTAREMTKDDINLVINYFLNATPAYLEALGVDITKLPARDEWTKIILREFDLPVEQKKLYYLIWQKDNVPIGHSHINDILFAKEAFMHLHLWNSLNRNKGDGTLLVKESLNYYFQKFNLQKIFCQPYALNPAPNHTLKNLGFELIKTYETVPGWLNFKQKVNLWQLDRGQYLRSQVNNFG